MGLTSRVVGHVLLFKVQLPRLVNFEHGLANEKRCHSEGEVARFSGSFQFTNAALRSANHQSINQAISKLVNQSVSVTVIVTRFTSCELTTARACALHS